MLEMGRGGEAGGGEIEWKAERPPSGLWVQWPAVGLWSWWPVEVLSPPALLPPEELRNLPLDILIRVLTSAQPLHRILAAEIRRKHDVNVRSPEGNVITDPHKKIDVSGFLLQRSRRVCGRVIRRVDKCPLRNVLVLSNSPLRTTGQQGQNTVCEEQNLILRNSDSAEDFLKYERPTLQILRNAGR